MRGQSLFLLLACGCSSGLSIPADRPVLSWSGSAASDANRSLLHGFAGPDVHSCAQDPTRVYIGELFFYGISDVQVPWHWAPIVSGPFASRPTLSQPEFFLAGALVGADDSTDDVLGDHPFGLDVDGDVQLDAPYAFLSFEGSGAQGTPLHTEVERRIFPRDALGFSPLPGDRVLMKGVWVLDCGHPPYGAEMHPPTFLHYARSPDARSTVAAAVVVPYRSALLFQPNVALATDFGNTQRLGDSASVPFSNALAGAVLHALLYNDDRLSTHGLMVPNRFDRLDWLVCAPLPRPAGATMDASWRFTARTGVRVQASRYETSGCVRFVATMDASYSPMPLAWAGADWPWDQLSASASAQLGRSIDVRQTLINQFNAPNARALQADHPPLVDAYPALQTRAGADQDSPIAIDSAADDQPFPFYGRIRVGWK
ncbi:MAG: hypothetical protein E6J78_12670 [Deltaproteobacteria bacterium]|nr:MAG: hypothetical protein E6J78_12670 [Deltaproteobacteria bacterium]